MEPREKIDLLCDEITSELKIYNDFVTENLICKTNELLKFIVTAPKEYRDMVEERLIAIVPQTLKYSRVWLLSAILSLSYSSSVMKDLLNYVIEEKAFSGNIRYFLYYQIKSTIFHHIHLENSETKYLKWKLLGQVVKQFEEELRDLLIPIPASKQDNDMVLVITEQILGEMHAPTKIALDRCKILMEEMHKKVLLINTAEILSEIGQIPYYEPTAANYWDDLLYSEIIEWKRTKIPYFQCEKNMPNISDLRTLLQMVRKLKPSLVVSIGGSGILINLIDKMIPVLTVGLSPSDMEATMTTCQTLSRPLNAEDIDLLHRLGKGENSIIQSIFTSSLQPQMTTVTKSELGLPEDKFILVIVGYRLDTDINEEFMRMLSKAVDDDIAVALIGEFKSYEDYMEKVPELRGKIYCLGLTQDILAWIEPCDLYINPYRKGGGTSGVEAVYQGIPVVTTPYGDVATNVGSDFWTESYETMPELIQKYKNDKSFYQEMSVRAKHRAEILLDTAGEFKRIIEEFEKRTKTNRKE